jgi:hypothetical protein
MSQMQQRGLKVANQRVLAPSGGDRRFCRDIGQEVGRGLMTESGIWIGSKNQRLRLDLVAPYAGELHAPLLSSEPQYLP